MVERSWTSKDFFAGNRLVDTAMCSDGSRIAVVDMDREVRVYSRSGELLGKVAASRVSRSQSLRWLEMSADGSLIVAGGNRRRGVIRVIGRDGEELWRRRMRLEQRRLFRDLCTIANDSSRMCIADGNAVCLFDREGNLEWRHNCPGPVSEIQSSVSLSHIAVGTPQSMLVLDGQGSLLWERGVGHSWSQFRIAADSSLICVTGREKSLCAYSPEGKLLWRHDSSDTIVPFDIGRDGRLVAVGSNDGRLVVCDRNKHLQFEHLDAGWVYPLKISYDGSMVVAGWDDRILRAFNSSGKLQWEHAGEEPAADEEIGIAVSRDGSVVVAAFPDGNLNVIDRDGKLLFEQEIGPYFIGPEVSDDGSIAVVIPDSERLTVLDTQDM